MKRITKIKVPGGWHINLMEGRRRLMFWLCPNEESAAFLVGVFAKVWPGSESTSIQIDPHNHDERVVGSYHNENTGLRVDTSMVSDGFQPYETGILHPRYNGGKWVIVEAYDTLEQARAGNDRWLTAMLGERDLPPKLVDCANSPASAMIRLAGGQMEFPLEPTP